MEKQIEAYKVTVRVTATVWVSEDEWRDEGGFGEFTEFQAQQFAKAELCQRLRNNPNYGSCKTKKYEIEE